jgi:hypothetical protein
LDEEAVPPVEVEAKWRIGDYGYSRSGGESSGSSVIETTEEGTTSPNYFAGELKLTIEGLEFTFSG